MPNAKRPSPRWRRPLLWCHEASLRRPAKVSLARDIRVPTRPGQPPTGIARIDDRATATHVARCRSYSPSMGASVVCGCWVQCSRGPAVVNHRNSQWQHRELRMVRARRRTDTGRHRCGGADGRAVDAVPVRPARDRRHRPRAGGRQRDRHRARRAQRAEASAEARDPLGHGGRDRRAHHAHARRRRAAQDSGAAVRGRPAARVDRLQAADPRGGGGRSRRGRRRDELLECAAHGGDRRHGHGPRQRAGGRRRVARQFRAGRAGAADQHSDRHLGQHAAPALRRALSGVRLLRRRRARVDRASR